MAPRWYEAPNTPSVFVLASAEVSTRATDETERKRAAVVAAGILILFIFVLLTEKRFRSINLAKHEPTRRKEVDVPSVQACN